MSAVRAVADDVGMLRRTLATRPVGNSTCNMQLGLQVLQACQCL